MKKSARKASSNGRARIDLTKPVKVSSAKGVRSKSDVFGTIAEQVGINRREVAGVFHVMGGLIKADLSKSGPGVFSASPAGQATPVDRLEGWQSRRKATSPS